MADISVVAADVDDVSPFKADIVPVFLAETVTAGQIGYQLADGTFGIADANAGGKQQARGVFLQGGTATGGPVDLLREGEVTGFGISGLNYDAPLYLSDTAGALADAAGTVTALVARVTGLTDKDKTKVLYFFFDWSEVYA